MTDKHVSIDVYDYSGNKLCCLYDSSIDAEGQAYDIVLVDVLGGKRELSFGLPYIVHKEKNFRWGYLKAEYLIRQTIGNETDWFILDSPVKKKNDKGLGESVVCSHLSTLLKTKNLYMEFDDTNGIGTLPELMNRILKGTTWSFDEERSDVFYEREPDENGNQVVKVRSLSRGGKDGAYKLIAECCALFDGYARFDANNKKVICYSMNNHGSAGTREMYVGKDLNALTVKHDSTSLITRLYVEGKYSDATNDYTSSGTMYVGIDKVEPHGLSYIMNFDYYRELGLFTPQHEEALQNYYNAMSAKVADINSVISALLSKETELSNLWGVIRYIYYPIRNKVIQTDEADVILGNDAPSSQIPFTADDTLVVLHDNGTHHNAKYSAQNGVYYIDYDEYGAEQEYSVSNVAGCVCVIKFVDLANGLIGAKQVAFETAVEQLASAEKKYAKEKAWQDEHGPASSWTQEQVETYAAKLSSFQQLIYNSKDTMMTPTEWRFFLNEDMTYVQWADYMKRGMKDEEWEAFLEDIVSSGKVYDHDVLAERMTTLFKNGNVDLLHRPKVEASSLSPDIRSAWGLSAGDYATVLSRGYSDQDGTMYLMMTPIFSDGDILESPDVLAAYAESLMDADDPLEADKVSNGGYGLVIDLAYVQEDETIEDVISRYEELGEVLHRLQAAYYGNSLPSWEDLEKEIHTFSEWQSITGKTVAYPKNNVWIDITNEDETIEGLYTLMDRARGLLLDVDALNKQVETARGQQDDIEATFAAAMGDMLKEGYWANTNYGPGQEAALYADALDVMTGMSKPKVTYTVSYVALSEKMGFEKDDLYLNMQVRLYDRELGVNDFVYIKEIKRYLDNPSNDSVALSNEDVKLSTVGQDTILSRISSLADIVDQKNALYERSKAIDANGSIQADRLEGLIDIYKTRLLSSRSNWYTDENGNLVFQSSDGQNAMMLTGEGFMVANGKDEDGNWDWRTFGTGEGFTADLITAGQMSAERIEAHTITARELRSDAGQSLDLSSNKSILLTVQNAQQEIMENVDSLVTNRLSILIESTSPFLSNSVASITLRARVWSGSDEVTDTINAERFNWYRDGGSSEADAAWNAAHKGMKQVTVARGDVLRQAVFRCELTEEE